MFRALLELFITILAAFVAKAIFSSLMKGFGPAMSSAFQQQQQQPPQQPGAAPPNPGPATGQLHKDPVCGTYVSESTLFRRQVSGKTIYYCSEACLQRHAA